jgi:GH24 family phage-related lysozyme (muramidase)
MAVKPRYVVLGALVGAGALYLLFRPKSANAAALTDGEPEGDLEWRINAALDRANYAAPAAPAKTGSDFIKHFMLMHEGRKKKVYLDTAGVPISTIGIGRAISQITRDTLGFWPKATDPPLTLAQIDALYAANTKYFDDQIKKHITVDLNQNQYDAIMDLLWNTGESPITSSPLKALLNAKDFEGAAKLIGSDQWAYKQGTKKPSQYLQKLRTFEADLFRTPVDADIEASLNEFYLKGGNGVVKTWHVPAFAAKSANWDYYDPDENVPPGP